MDFAQPSIHAFQFAVELARKSKGSIRVVHVIDFPPMAYLGMPDYPVYTIYPELLKDMKDHATKQFHKMVKRFGLGISDIQFEVPNGLVFPTLRRYIRDKKFDVVVMGSHGSSVINELIFGSVAEKVLRFSKSPVLVIRKKISVSSIKNILFPVSLEKGQSLLIKKVKELQSFFNARLHLLYVNTPFKYFRDKDLNQFAERNKFSNYTTSLAYELYPSDGILNFAQDRGFDLLIMTTHARKGLRHLVEGSITEDVVNRISQPIWTFSIK